MIVTPGHIRDIADLVTGRVIQHARLADVTTFKIGGPAELLIEPGAPEELRAALAYLREARIPVFILGSGSNVLFRDEGFPGAVIRLTGLRGFTIQSNGSDYAKVSAAAGEPLPALINRCAGDGLRGPEALWGIPASVGGAVVSNAGARGVWIGDLLSEITIVTPAAAEQRLARENFSCSYRSIDLPASAVVTAAGLRLVRDDPDAVEASMEAARKHRWETQPMGFPSAGCVFKNPAPDNPAGAIIDRLGFKGRSVGGARVSDAHANFIVNAGGASAGDVLALIEEIREAVRAAEGVDLELEIRIAPEGPAHA